MQPLNFSNAAINDLEEIVNIYNSTIPSRMVTADTEPVTVNDRFDWFNEHIKNPLRPLWIIKEEHSRIIGWVSFSSFYGRAAYNATAEISIYLHADVRGKGVGRKVLEHCIAAAPSLKINTLLGYIFSHNETSIKLFNSCGFETWGTLPGIAVLDGMERTLLIVGKRLSFP